MTISTTYLQPVIVEVSFKWWYFFVCKFIRATYCAPPAKKNCGSISEQGWGYITTNIIIILYKKTYKNQDSNGLTLFVL